MARYGLDLPGLEYGQMADALGAIMEYQDSMECAKCLD